MAAEDKERMEAAVKEVIDWLDGNQLAEVDELEHKRKELEAVCSPIVARLYQGGGGAAAAGGGMPERGAAAGSGSMPHVEEVD